MKWLIASDIHGSARYCEELLNAFDMEGAGKLLLLGDLLYHGPRNPLTDLYSTEKVASMLNGMKDRIVCVRGNCDSEVDQMVLEFPIMAEYALIDVCGKTMFATHGHRYSRASLPPLGTCDILLNGHTHVPECEEHDTYIYMNPGSISLPKMGSAHSYMTVEDGHFKWMAIEGECFMEYDLKV